jgi:hypothetical protein
LVNGCPGGLPNRAASAMLEVQPGMLRELP